MFEILVFPIILYGCEIWGTQPEVGKLPLHGTIDKRLMSFWLRLLNKEESSLVHIVYMIAHNLFVHDVYKAKWLYRVKDIFDNCGLSYLWLNQSMMDTNHTKQLIHTRVEEIAKLVHRYLHLLLLLFALGHGSSQSRFSSSR